MLGSPATWSADLGKAKSFLSAVDTELAAGNGVKAAAAAYFSAQYSDTVASEIAAKYPAQQARSSVVSSQLQLATAAKDTAASAGDATVAGVQAQIGKGAAQVAYATAAAAYAAVPKSTGGPIVTPPIVTPPVVAEKPTDWTPWLIGGSALLLGIGALMYFKPHALRMRAGVRENPTSSGQVARRGPVFTGHQRGMKYEIYEMERKTIMYMAVVYAPVAQPGDPYGDLTKLSGMQLDRLRLRTTLAAAKAEAHAHIAWLWRGENYLTRTAQWR